MLIAGVDEAGRGPLAGPVTVAAVILKTIPPGLDDSKKLTAKKRAALYPLIIDSAWCWSISHISAADIDRMNILQATLWGMQKVVEQLKCRPDEVLVDGNQVPDVSMLCRAIIGGDGLEPCISAASILAKESRDRLMLKLHHQYPHYGFDRHKGYPTAAHMTALQQWGPCPQHRFSFAPVGKYQQQEIF